MSWNFGGYAEAVYEPKALLTYTHQWAHQGKFLLLAFGSFEDPIHSLLLALKDEPCTCGSAIVIYLYHYQPLCVCKIWFQFLNKSLHPFFLVFKSICGIEQAPTPSYTMMSKWEISFWRSRICIRSSLGILKTQISSSLQHAVVVLATHYYSAQRGEKEATTCVSASYVLGNGQGPDDSSREICMQACSTPGRVIGGKLFPYVNHNAKFWKGQLTIMQNYGEWKGHVTHDDNNISWMRNFCNLRNLKSGSINLQNP